MYTINDIDIFIATHNRAEILEETITCLLKQTVPLTEVTVLDNESSDNTEAVVKRYEEKGFKYVKTFTRAGNFLKAQELASKEFCIILHDDNLIHQEFFEKVLYVLNNIKDVTAVTSSFKIFETNSAKTLPQEFPKEYIHAEPLNNTFMIIDSPRQYMINNIKSSVYPFNKPLIGGTPFLVLKTTLYKEYKPTNDKYGKADDLYYFLYIIERGKMVCIYDERAAFFRGHPLRDSNLDKNSLTLEQTENFFSLYGSMFKNDEDEYLWRDIFEIFYRIYPSFIKNNVKEKYPPFELIQHLINNGVFPAFCRKYLKKFSDLETCVNIKMKENKQLLPKKEIRKLSKLQKIFSIINDSTDGDKEKVITILGQQFRYKVNLPENDKCTL